MKKDFDEKIIKSALDNIRTPEYDIFSKVEKEIKNKESNISFKKAISVGVAICLCLTLSVGVMAATIPSFNKLLSVVSLEIASILQRVEVSSEDNGIKMEVIAAMSDDETTVIYFTMQDLTGDRIDETLNISDYGMSKGSMFTCELVDYNKSTKTATLRMESNGGEKINNEKVEFNIRSFVGDRSILHGIDTGITIVDILAVKDSQTIPFDMKNLSGIGGDLIEELRSQDTIELLKVDQMNLTLPKIDLMHISNIGYIDGRLHIQTKWSRDRVNDYGDLYLADSSGNTLDVRMSNVYFGVNESNEATYGNGYIEYIFDIDKTELNEVKLMATFTSNRNYTEGNWKTSFKIEAIEEQKKIDCNIELGTGSIDSISVSPLGVTLTGSVKDIPSYDSISVSINMKDGSTKTFSTRVSSVEDGKTKLKYMPSLPLDLSLIKSININGTIIKMNSLK
ncbi:hypothetical protein Curi_c12140 [Gottschalkia acidurici 9a]|uniref:Uncharacterized protein n=1 Tax=Gottschalkia acidurici (strain ATCC 7906 / DSM 604 / BCRC 14475 / CIP 104303 / KCTC 5404 / NCIMB 10678 / 9a) TaxID=1128398 RepID=K0AZS7_GOTA9|nr:DUF4179 domain-containing protein [Gottschalkia acidurici]AFS78225.1 hypothetical protein Curi_c12140 [Gottschalkia acidurici 9a]